MALSFPWIMLGFNPPVETRGLRLCLKQVSVPSAKGIQLNLQLTSQLLCPNVALIAIKVVLPNKHYVCCSCFVAYQRKVSANVT